MSLYAHSEHPSSARQLANSREKLLQCRPDLEPHYMLECGNGASIPLRHTGRNEFQQFFAIDESICSGISIRIEKYRGSSPPTIHQSQHNLQSALLSGLPSPFIETNPSRYEGQALKYVHPNKNFTRWLQGNEARIRVDAPTMAHARQSAAPTTGENDHMTIPAGFTPTGTAEVARGIYQSTQSSRDIMNNHKVHCTYWIRHGECDYMQQGCRYKHEMPGLETLRAIGFQSVPRWYREKMSLASALPLRSKPEFRQMIESEAIASSISSATDSTSESDYSSSTSPAIHQRKPQMIRPLPPSSIIDKASMEPLKPVTTHTPTRSFLAAAKEEKLDSPMHLVSVGSNKPVDSEIPPRVPQNSPELSAFRRGHFIPTSEELSTKTSAKILLQGLPTKSVAVCSSPLRLDSPKGTPVSTSPSAPDESFTGKGTLPQFKHYFDDKSEETSPLLRREDADITRQPPLSMRPQFVTDQTKLQQENDALKAQLAALMVHKTAEDGRLPTSSRPAGSVALQPRSHSGLMASKYRVVETKAKLDKEKTSYALKKMGSKNGKTVPKGTSRKGRVTVQTTQVKRGAVGPIGTADIATNTSSINSFG